MGTEEEELLVVVVDDDDDADAESDDDAVDASLDPFFAYFLSLRKPRLAIAWLIRLLQRGVSSVARRVTTAIPAARIIPFFDQQWLFVTVFCFASKDPGKRQTTDLCASNANFTLFELQKSRLLL